MSELFYNVSEWAQHSRGWWRHTDLEITKVIHPKTSPAHDAWGCCLVTQYEVSDSLANRQGTSGSGSRSTFRQSTISTVWQKYKADLLVFPSGFTACRGHALKSGSVWSHGTLHLTSREANRKLPSGGAEVSALARGTSCLLEVPCRPQGTTLTDLEWRERADHHLALITLFQMLICIYTHTLLLSLQFKLQVY